MEAEAEATTNTLPEWLQHVVSASSIAPDQRQRNASLSPLPLSLSHRYCGRETDESPLSSSAAPPHRGGGAAPQPKGNDEEGGAAGAVTPQSVNSRRSAEDGKAVLQSEGEKETQGDIR